MRYLKDIMNKVNKIKYKEGVNIIMENKTPNCSICKWFKEIKLFLIYERRCTAQGYKYATISYNTPHCRDLFEKKD